MRDPKFDRQAFLAYYLISIAEAISFSERNSDEKYNFRTTFKFFFDIEAKKKKKIFF